MREREEKGSEREREEKGSKREREREKGRERALLEAGASKIMTLTTGEGFLASSQHGRGCHMARQSKLRPLFLLQSH
jgi:hypothetical protein